MLGDGAVDGDVSAGVRAEPRDADRWSARICSTVLIGTWLADTAGPAVWYSRIPLTETAMIDAAETTATRCCRRFLLCLAR